MYLWIARARDVRWAQAPPQRHMVPWIMLDCLCAAAQIRIQLTGDARVLVVNGRIVTAPHSRAHPPSPQPQPTPSSSPGHNNPILNSWCINKGTEFNLHCTAFVGMRCWFRGHNAFRRRHSVMHGRVVCGVLHAYSDIHFVAIISFVQPFTVCYWRVNHQQSCRGLARGWSGWSYKKLALCGASALFEKDQGTINPWTTICSTPVYFYFVDCLRWWEAKKSFFLLPPSGQSSCTIIYSCYWIGGIIWGSLCVIKS